MRRSLHFVALLVLVTAGCTIVSETPDAQPTPALDAVEPTQASSAPEQSPSIDNGDDDAFLESLRLLDPGLYASSSPADLVSLGQAACGLISQEGNIYAFVESVTNTMRAEALTLAAVPSYCPEHLEALYQMDLERY
ncbi:DUF732 domain-containing protein [Microcella alkalica]|uniref:DUF732 domain-containing protein n=1 Tax=Microcella alkalica TaxID=355930 RepID=A0A839E7Y1_9MICO|nr:DUF732 domain-containing protein [Microcella alkalica]MBA8847396.1 hypothetical protein [Microcella alkalica]